MSGARHEACRFGAVTSLRSPPYLEQIRDTIPIVGRLDPATIDPDAEALLLHAFRDWKAR
jgi:hypothetical protein